MAMTQTMANPRSIIWIDFALAPKGNSTKLTPTILVPALQSLPYPLLTHTPLSCQQIPLSLSGIPPSKHLSYQTTLFQFFTTFQFPLLAIIPSPLLEVKKRSPHFLFPLKPHNFFWAERCGKEFDESPLHWYNLATKFQTDTLSFNSGICDRYSCMSF